MKTKIEMLEKIIDEHKQSFVTTDLFNAIISRIKDDLHDMRSDIKEVLHLVSKNTKIKRGEDSL